MRLMSAHTPVSTSPTKAPSSHLSHKAPTGGGQSAALSSRGSLDGISVVPTSKPAAASAVVTMFKPTRHRLTWARVRSDRARLYGWLNVDEAVRTSPKYSVARAHAVMRTTGSSERVGDRPSSVKDGESARNSTSSRAHSQIRATF